MPAELFLDSGAYSAFSHGAEIQIEDYIQFIKDHENMVEVYANLDVIGDPKGTWRNQRIMEKAGLKPLPAFHYGEPIQWLRRYLDRYDYIALGGMVPISTKDLTNWCDYLFSNFLTDNKGLPTVKVHGFGMTSLSLLFRYPWYSVDSTSWLLIGAMGGVLVPVKRNGKYDYRKAPFKVDMSARQPSSRIRNKHMKTLSPNVKAHVEQYIKEKGYKIGKSRFVRRKASYKPKDGERWFGKERNDGTRIVEIIIQRGLCNCHVQRKLMNLIYMKDLEANFPQWPWRFKKKTVHAGFGITI